MGKPYTCVSFSCLIFSCRFLWILEPCLLTFLVLPEPRKTHKLWVSLDNLLPVLLPLRFLSKQVFCQTHATFLNAVNLLGRDLLYKIRATIFPGRVFLKLLGNNARMSKYEFIHTDSKSVLGVCHVMGQVLKKRGFPIPMATNMPHGKLTADLLESQQLLQRFSVIRYRAFTRQ